MLEQALDDADPMHRVPPLFDDELVRINDRAWAQAATALPRSRRRRMAFLIAVPAVLLLALTGGGVAWQMSIGDVAVQADLVVPVDFTTDDGTHVSCRVQGYIGDPQTRTSHIEAVVAELRAHDWSGLGQRIYDRLRDKSAVGAEAVQEIGDVVFAADGAVQLFSLSTDCLNR